MYEVLHFCASTSPTRWPTTFWSILLSSTYSIFKFSLSSKTLPVHVAIALIAYLLTAFPSPRNTAVGMQHYLILVRESCPCTTHVAHLYCCCQVCTIHNQSSSSQHTVAEGARHLMMCILSLLTWAHLGHLLLTVWNHHCHMFLPCAKCPITNLVTVGEKWKKWKKLYMKFVLEFICWTLNPTECEKDLKRPLKDQKDLRFQMSQDENFSLFLVNWLV